MNPHSPVRIAIPHTLLRHCSKTESGHGRRPGLCGIPPDADRIELAERMREIVAAARKAEQGKRNDLAQNIPQNFGECSGPKERETDARLGALAGGGRPCNISQQKPPQNFAEVSHPDARNDLAQNIPQNFAECSDPKERETNARLGALAGVSLSIQDNPPQSFGEGSNPDERETNARLGALAGVSRTAQHAATATRIHSPGQRARVEGYTTTSYSEDGEERMRRKRKQRLSMKDLGNSRPLYRRYAPERLPEKEPGEQEERGEQATTEPDKREER